MENDTDQTRTDDKRQDDRASQRQPSDHAANDSHRRAESGAQPATRDDAQSTDRTGTGRYDTDDASTHDGLGGVSGSLGNRSDIGGQRADWDNGMIGTTPEGRRPMGEDGAEPEPPMTDEERMRAQGATEQYRGSGSSSHGGIETIGAATDDSDRDTNAESLGAGPQGRVQVTGATDTRTMPGQPDLSEPDQGDAGDVRRDESSARRARSASDDTGPHGL